jgi:hypothetical protein
MTDALSVEDRDPQQTSTLLRFQAPRRIWVLRTYLQLSERLTSLVSSARSTATSVRSVLVFPQELEDAEIIPFSKPERNESPSDAPRTLDDAEVQDEPEIPQTGGHHGVESTGWKPEYRRLVEKALETKVLKPVSSSEFSEVFSMTIDALDEAIQDVSGIFRK